MHPLERNQPSERQILGEHDRRHAPGTKTGDVAVEGPLADHSHGSPYPRWARRSLPLGGGIERVASPPACLASYIARSASITIVSPVSSSTLVLNIATPIEMVTFLRSPPSSAVLDRTAFASASATCAASASSAFGSSTANSSPPSLASTSEVRRRPRSTPVIETISSSPALCPSVSLTDLKWSTSTTSSAPSGP